MIRPLVAVPLVAASLVAAWLVAASLLVAARHASAPPRVTIDTGTLEGVDTAGVLLFNGVPYAAPPVGALRWKPPRPAARWSGVREADRLGRNCPQGQPYPEIDPYAAGQSEDCLYLNVWTSSLGGRKPVMVWIHGGGFFAGFGGEERHDGSPLARKGVVVVTLNYRLGPFGFMAHPALAAESPRHTSGNYGLLDQIAALQWVKRNVARFGGDPTKVTIFGESAGAMSVGALVASPLAKGLFRGAVLESGTGIAVGVERLDSAEAKGVRLAAALGIEGRGADAPARLRAAPAESVLAAAGRLGRRDSPVLWPTVDGWVLPHSVDSALALGTASRVPVVVGSNRDEPDFVFGAPARSFARLTSARGAPTYLYVFTRAGEDSVGRRSGAYHNSEIPFVFGRPHPLWPAAGRASYDSTLAEAMSDYWVSFATSLDPNGPPNAGTRPRWPRYDRASEPYLELGPEIVPRSAWRAAAYDSLDAAGRRRGEVRP